MDQVLRIIIPPLNGSFLEDLSLREFRQHLLAWYGTNRRDLPWRNTSDPYRIWISEIMLQQTRVAAVIPHYQRFLHRFPTIEKLAYARESSVLAAWSGLGYYRRARSMHAAAKVIVKEYKSIFPRKRTELSALPGIGEYTSAAIASIAFGQPIAAVDGNVQRVLQRMLGKALTAAAVRSVADQLLSRENPGDFNQAMMELGATVCLPQQPKCSLCPVTKQCGSSPAIVFPQAVKSSLDARRRVTVSSHQPSRRKKTVRYILDTQKDSVFLVKRSDDASLMPRMWELPKAFRKGDPCMRLRHSITTTDYEVFVTRAWAPAHVKGKWVKNDRAKSLPLTGLARKILIAANIIQVAS